MRLFCLLLSVFCLRLAGADAFGQEQSVRIVWKAPKSITLPTGKEVLRYTAHNALNPLEEGGNPIYTLSLDGRIAQYEITKPIYKVLTKAEKSLFDTTQVGKSLVEKLTYEEFHEDKSLVQIRLLRRNSTSRRLERLMYFTPLIRKGISNARGGVGDEPGVASDTAQAYLASGKWAKVGVTENGVYKLTADNLRRLGLDVSTLNPQNLHMYGRGGANLPEVIGVAKPGLHELAIQVVGQEDGRFDNGDYILFYGEGPGTWRYNKTTKRYEHVTFLNGRGTINDVHEVNLFADTIQYLVGSNDVLGLRVPTRAEVEPTRTVASFTNYQYVGKDAINVLKAGRRWFSESFDLTRNKDYVFTTPALVAGSRAELRIAGAARSVGGASTSGPITTFIGRVNGAEVASVPMQGVSNYAFGDNYRDNDVTGTFAQQAGDNVLVQLAYEKGGNIEAIGYLDFIELATRQNATFRNRSLQMWFPEQDSLGAAALAISNLPPSGLVWQLNKSLQPQSIPIVNGQVGLLDSTAQHIIAFAPEQTSSPILMGAIANQALATTPAPAFVIITQPQFVAKAQELATHRTTLSGIPTLVVTPQQVYTEFTGGHQDITGLRDFIYSLYKQPGSALKYVLLFGDGSFDYKNRVANNTNFVPTYESDAWQGPVDAWGSDDYYGVMTVGGGPLTGTFLTQKPSLGVGRIPIRNEAQAAVAVDKLIKYDIDTAAKGVWRNVNAFVADNGDCMLHTSQADNVAAISSIRDEALLTEKYYLSAYPLVAGPGGLTSPEMRSAISRRLRAGALIVNYTGHGSEYQWADERIFDFEAMANLDNGPRLPFFITATCTFGRYDDPGVISGAEELVTMRGGGAIGVFSACRPVYSSSNQSLHLALYEGLLTPLSNGRMPTVGQVVMSTKNSNGGSNSYSYALFGDPTVTLAYPLHKVVVDSMLNASNQLIDTIRALQTVTLKGSILKRGTQQVHTDFNGSLQITLYDKQNQLNLQEGGCSRVVSQRKSVIFNGITAVDSGKWTATFQLPLDINYVYGEGFLSFYAQANVGLEDAKGKNSRGVVVGGSVITGLDDDPPLVKLYMNDFSFRSGGIVGPNPIFLARVSDNSGINVSLSGIGHEMIGRFSTAPTEAVVMNSFYVSDIGRPNQGTVRFPLQNLAPGTYKIYFTVWDLHNNSASDSIQFTVGEQKNGCPTLARPTVSPNPVIDKAVFAVDNSLAGQPLEVKVQIFDLLGRDMGQVQTSHTISPARLGQGLEWDPRVKSGTFLEPSVYIYRITTTSQGGCQASTQGRMVINR